MQMTTVRAMALKVRRTCPACMGYGESCQQCREGLVEEMPDTARSAYLVGAESVPHFVARLLILIGQSRKDELQLIARGEKELAIVESARRSGMAEVARAVSEWWGQRNLTMRAKHG